ncbi:unnamed protein product (macronuclear) [Paramecium tetraurelia]|uniref:H-type lectin domain-containing protein n=1 Tax=Paramecium tetraurelia TaxID=5888 RepID=A0C1D5_PARTE|nr:uncharacterized protein GSPATT00034078001 [Paramecium tetraurelia]CAK64602.1 unnamed protein product [Paramecium tetraurelia]|eukprot:XP_001432000.1 hypothetical protein (macronuclear) [Paramecium tetraurelia strain d4-2]
MKTIFVNTILVVIYLGQVSGLSFDDPNCMKYLNKFGTVSNAERTATSKLAFTGYVSFVQGNTIAQVNLRYNDDDLFTDVTYFGLVKEDGKSADEVCLDLKLWQYTSNKYSDPVQVTDLTITSSTNFSKFWRYYVFTIPRTELKTRLVETSNTEQFIYTGYFALAYYATGTDSLQYTFFFEFSIIINKATDPLYDPFFKPLSQRSTFNCTITSACNAIYDTKVNWCTDLKCSTFAIPDLHLNDEFVLQQFVTTAGMEGFYLTETEVWYTGNGLLKKASPISINNTILGQVIIQLKAEIAWTEVTIKVTSTLSAFQTGRRRILFQTQFDPVFGETQQIQCIKAEGSDSCPTCIQEWEANGFAHDGCPSCCFSHKIAFVFFAILLLIFTI